MMLLTSSFDIVLKDSGNFIAEISTRIFGIFQIRFAVILSHKFFFLQNVKMNADDCQNGKYNKKKTGKNQCYSSEIKVDRKKKRISGE